MDAKKPLNAPVLDVPKLLNELGAAVMDAKAKADVVTKQKAELADLVAKRQLAIDEAQTAYADAKVAAERLQEHVRSVFGELMPATDARFRVSQ